MDEDNKYVLRQTCMKARRSLGKLKIDGYHILALSALRNRNHKKAHLVSDKIIKTAPGNHIGYRYKAVAFMGTGKIDENLIDLLDTSLAIKPDDNVDAINYQKLKLGGSIGGAAYSAATFKDFATFWKGTFSSSTVALKAAEIMLNAYMYAEAKRKLQEEAEDIADELFPGFASAINFQVRNFILGNEMAPLIETVYSDGNIRSFEVHSYQENEKGDRTIDFTFTDENGDLKRRRINF
uniref:Uncharacterized protein n=1 Tax=Candidatus Kentrum sp. LFY TaxID=2126342 RepID=A0A450WCJ1_9GAMM|nr:MAG: hypothetical protein BECKLFY1418C_GA0070996_10114 [Candidatus Kentron sp. LFY]